MTHASLASWRNLAGWMGTLCLFLVLACLFDGAQAGGRKDPNLNELLPGQRLKISGPMPRDTEKLGDLSLRSGEPALGLRLEETYSGFWMGGQLWRAEVHAPANLAPGDYDLALSARNETSPKLTQRFTLRVYADQKAQDRASLSLAVRTLGVSPFLLAALLLPAGVGFGIASTLLSRRHARLLRGLGQGLVFRVQRTPEGLRVYYPLGAQDGLAEGDEMEFLDPKDLHVLCTAPLSTLRGADSDSLLPQGSSVPINAVARRVGQS